MSDVERVLAEVEEHFFPPRDVVRFFEDTGAEFVSGHHLRDPLDHRQLIDARYEAQTPHGTVAYDYAYRPEGRAKLIATGPQAAVQVAQRLFAKGAYAS